MTPWTPAEWSAAITLIVIYGLFFLICHVLGIDE